MKKSLFMRNITPLIILLFITPLFTYGKDTLKIATLITSGEQRSIMSSLLNRFNKKHADIDVELIMLPDAEFKVELNNWLDTGQGPDIITWQAGERLYQYVRNHKVKSIDTIWQHQELEKQFNQGSRNAVSWENKVYGIPISYYQWGFYYRKSTFEKFNLTPPKTWSEFLNVCKILKQNNVTPITLGNKFKWPSAAWFDYFNLRLNGLEFHLQLLRGERSFNDPKVFTVFKYWKELLDLDYFIEYHDSLKWNEAMPFLYHRLAGMTLIGNFFSGNMPELLKEDFRYFRFPIMNDNIPVFEAAPLDIFMVPHYTKINSTVERFLTFVASSEFQEPYNNKAGTIAPNLTTKEPSDYFSILGKKVLEEAEGLSQFFDRDTNAAMSDEAITIFSNFIVNRNIEMTINSLERAKNKHLKNN